MKEWTVARNPKRLFLDNEKCSTFIEADRTEDLNASLEPSRLTFNSFGSMPQDFSGYSLKPEPRVDIYFLIQKRAIQYCQP